MLRTSPPFSLVGPPQCLPSCPFRVVKRACSPERRRRASGEHIANIADLSLPISQLTSLVTAATAQAAETARLQDKQSEQIQLLADKQEKVFKRDPRMSRASVV